MCQKNTHDEHYSSNSVLQPGNGRLEWWNKDQIILLKKVLNNHILLDFLDILAENAGTWVGIEDVCKTLDCSLYKLRGNLSRLTPCIKEHFVHNPIAWWPVEIEKDHNQSPGFLATYRMHPQIAQWWKG